MKARVYVSLKKSVFDPQGKAVHDALSSLGYAAVAEVRQGKFFDVSLEGLDASQAQATLDDVARRVLANPVIESYEVEIRP
jgi:phosphoribosylformylglycinamidine synthase PurS subunit